MTAETAVRSGAIIQVNEKEPSQYEVTQLENGNELPKAVPNADPKRIEIDWSFGPVHVVGYVVPVQPYEIGVEIKIAGIQLGHFYGNLEKGLVIKVNLLAAKGEITFFIKKNGAQKEVWLKADIKITFDGHIEKEVKLFNLP